MKQKIFIILLSLPLLFAGCQSYKQVPYLQGNMQQAAQSDTTALNPTLYDARIMPKDLLTIVVSCPEAPELAEPFNLTVSSPISNTGNKYLTSQPVLQQYLVDNRGNIDFPVLGTIHLGGLTKGEALCTTPTRIPDVRCTKGNGLRNSVATIWTWTTNRFIHSVMGFHTLLSTMEILRWTVLQCLWTEV